MASIDIDDCENCGRFHLKINGLTYMTSPSRGVCVRNARILETASNMPRKEAQRYLAHEIGYEEDYANQLINVLADSLASPPAKSRAH